MSVSGGGQPSPDLLRGHRRVAIDANVLIALFEDPTRRGEVAARLLDAFETGEAEGLAASIVLTEVLAGPARAGDVAGFELLADELRSASLKYVAISAEIATDAAWYRATRSIAFADALHLASARAAGATAFVTNDRRIRSVPQLDVIQLDDLVDEPEPTTA